MTNTFKNWTCAATLAAVLPGFFSDALAVEYRDAGAVAASAAGDLISIESDQAQYQVNEPIRFTVESRRAGYLYMFAIDSESGAAYFLEPGPGRDALRVVPGMSFEVPPPGIEFYGDRAGVERVVVISSPGRIDLGDMDGLAADDGAIELAGVHKVFAKSGLDVSRAGVRSHRDGWSEVRYLDIEVINGSNAVSASVSSAGR